MPAADRKNPLFVGAEDVDCEIMLWSKISRIAGHPEKREVAKGIYQVDQH